MPVITWKHNIHSAVHITYEPVLEKVERYHTTRLGPSGWEVVILSSCGVSPKPGDLIHSWRGGEAANRALLPGEQPMCHIVSDVTAAKGPEPPGPLITGTQMGRGGDLPGEHGRRMAKVESPQKLKSWGKQKVHRKFYRPCCSYLFMASCIFQLFDKIGFLRFFQRKRLKKWNCEGSQVLSDSPRLCRFRPFANEKLKSWGKKSFTENSTFI